jgi:serine/threonine protein kinase
LALAAGAEQDGDLEGHVSSCDACQQRVRRFRDELGNLRSAYGETPTAGQFDTVVLPPQRPTTPVQSLLQPPQGPDELGRLGPYRVLQVLGQGGMGFVLRAEHMRLGRQDALKIMRPEAASDATSRERFLAEARAAAQIHSEHVIPIYQADECDGVLFIAMPLLVGETLDARLKRERRLPLEELLRLGCETAQGLAAAHARGVIHRDLKPSNLWLETDPAGGPFRRVLVLDFGLARSFDGSQGLTDSGVVVGTPAYLSPEQAKGQGVDARSDLFSLGVVLYVAASGTRPFVQENLLATLRSVMEDEPPPLATVNADLPGELCDLIHRLLSKAPGDRPASAAEVAAELAVLMGESGETVPGDALRTRQSSGTRRQLLMVLLAVIVLPVLVPVGWHLWHVGGSNSNSGDGTRQPLSPTDPANEAALSPLRVKSLNIRHLAKEGADFRDRGLLGERSMSAQLHDAVTVEAELSRPAYAYLIAFRGDGTSELCFPESETEPPPLTDRPRYPSESRDEAYGLAEGAGLWVFAVVAAEKPLPPFHDWWSRAQILTPWKSESAADDVVWWDDGQWIERLPRDGAPARGDRAKGVKLPGQSAVVRLADWLRESAKGDAVGAMGFAVRTK